MVRVAGFEPAASWSQTRHSSNWAIPTYFVGAPPFQHDMPPSAVSHAMAYPILIIFCGFTHDPYTTRLSMGSEFSRLPVLSLKPTLYGNLCFSLSQNRSEDIKCTPISPVSLCCLCWLRCIVERGDSTEVRTPIVAVKGRCPDRLDDRTIWLG